MNKLEEIDFEIENATEEFVELRKNLQCMTRKLSLTSGISSTGSHITADGKVIEEMNCTNIEKNHEEKKSLQNAVFFRDGDPNVELSHKVLLTLSESNRKCLTEYIVKSIVTQTDRKVAELSNILLAYNVELLKKVTNKYADGGRKYGDHV